MSNFTTLNIQRDPSSTTDRVYYNMDFYNSETVDDNKNQPDMRYTDFRTSPILENANDYLFSIIRFQLNGVGSAIPLFVPIIENGTDVNKTIYKITLLFSVNDGSGFRQQAETMNVMYSPQNKAASVPTKPNDYSNEYYFVNSYNHFVEMINNTLQQLNAKLIQDLNMASVQPPPAPPVLHFEPDTQTFKLYLDGGRYGRKNEAFAGGADCKARIFFNSNLFNLFQSFNHEYTGGDVKNNIKYFDTDMTTPKFTSIPDAAYDILPVKTYGLFLNQFQPNDPDNEITYNIVSQEFGSLSSFWTPVSSLVFTTNIMPILPEITGPPVEFKDNSSSISNSNDNDYSKIITDMIVPLGSPDLYKSTITYYPEAQYRMSEFIKSNFALRNIGLSGFYKLRTTGQLIPLRLPNQASVSIKILFKKKDAY